MTSTDLIRANRPTTNELAPIPDAVAERFSILDPENQAEMMELLAENLNEGEALSISNLTKVGNPSGTSLAFTIPDPAKPGKSKVTDSLRGIVLGWQDGRTFYKSNEASADTPPDCSSRDAMHGFGEFGSGSEANPSGLCTDCPMGQWQRVEGGKDIPPACKPMVNVLLLTEAESLPWLVRVPRTSMKGFADYRKSLIRFGTGLARSVVEIGLEQKKNPEGVAYGEMTFSMVEKLGQGRAESKAVANAALAFGEEMKKVITAPSSREVDIAISATAERVTIENEGGASFGDVPADAPGVDDDFGPDADELSELDESGTSTPVAS